MACTDDGDYKPHRFCRRFVIHIKKETIFSDKIRLAALWHQLTTEINRNWKIHVLNMMRLLNVQNPCFNSRTTIHFHIQYMHSREPNKKEKKKQMIFSSLLSDRVLLLRSLKKKIFQFFACFIRSGVTKR